MSEKPFEYFDRELKTVLMLVIVTSLGLSLGINAILQENIADTVMVFVGMFGIQLYLVYKWSYYHTLSELATSAMLAEAQRQLAIYEAKYGNKDRA